MEGNLTVVSGPPGLALENLTPLVRLSIFLDAFIPCLDQSLYITPEKNSIAETTQGSVWSHKLYDVDHDGSILAGLEVMLVPHCAEVALSLLIHEETGLNHFGYFRSKHPCFEEMFRLPRH